MFDRCKMGAAFLAQPPSFCLRKGQPGLPLRGATSPGEGDSMLPAGSCKGWAPKSPRGEACRR